MAEITPTIEEVINSGSFDVVTGTVVLPDTNANEFAVVGTSGHVFYCNVECTTDHTTNDTRVVINQEDDFSTAKQGTVAIQAEAADTFRFKAGVIR